MTSSTAAAWETQPLKWPGDLCASIAGLADEPELAWIDAPDFSQPGSPPAWSLIACEPLGVIEQFDLGGRTHAFFLIGGEAVDDDANVWRLWQRAGERLPKLPAAPTPLAPGWIGYVGFEAARQIERLPARNHDDLGLPLARLALFDTAIVLNHRTRAATLLRPREPVAPWIPRRERERVRELLVEVCERSAGPAAAPKTATLAEHGAARVLRNAPVHAAFERSVARALEYIAAGDVYQVNLAHRIELPDVPDPLAAFASIRAGGAPPHAALLRWAGGPIVSASPELLLRVDGARVLTRPIKGTRPRSGDPTADETMRAALLASTKDAAELAMIVDLHRNDLGRVCAPGSVRVECARRVEAHAGVFHTLADISGTLAPGRDALDALVAAFPAGSVTGVPKIRALEIIDELEPVARNAYCGSVLALGFDGRLTANVAIRTVQMSGERAVLHVGAGIVADSDPAEELAETLAKARGVIEGLAGAPRLTHAGNAD